MGWPSAVVRRCAAFASVLAFATTVCAVVVLATSGNSSSLAGPEDLRILEARFLARHAAYQAREARLRQWIGGAPREDVVEFRRSSQRRPSVVRRLNEDPFGLATDIERNADDAHRGSVDFFRSATQENQQLWRGNSQQRIRQRRAFGLEAGEPRAALSDPEAALSTTAEWFMRKLWAPVQELAGNGTLSSQCVSGLLAVYSGIRHGHLWALKFLDATGKFPTGVLAASSPSSDPGSYEECLAIGYENIASERSGKHPGGIFGQYCSLLWDVSKASIVARHADVSGGGENTSSFTRNIRQGVCVPSHCSRHEVEAIALKVLNGSLFSTRVSACRSQKDFTINHVQLAVICLFIMWVTLTAISTLLHFCWERKVESTKGEIDCTYRSLVVAISAVTSVKRLLLVHHDRHMAAVQPLKAVSLVWIVLGMTYRSRLLDGASEEQWRHSSLYTLATSSDLAFTTVLLVSGYALANTALELHRLKVGYVRRLLALHSLKNRLTISAVFTLAAFLLYPLFVDGPAADRVLPRLSGVCHQRWGYVFAHMNNLHGDKNICYHPLWLISCEMQIFFTLSAIVVLIRRFKKVAPTLLSLIGIGAVAGVAAFVAVRGYQPPVAISTRESTRTVSDVVYLPFLHLPAFIIGVLFNNWMVSARKSHGNKFTGGILWLLSAAILVWGVLYPCLWKSWVPAPTSAAATVLFIVGLRLAWCGAITFVLWAASTCKAGLVRYILECRTVAALGRLSLSAYLCSWMIAMHASLSPRNTPEIGPAFMLRDFVANTALSYAAALLFYVMCDGPAQSLCSLLRRMVIGREAARRRSSVDECDRKVRFLSELLGVDAPPSPTKEQQPHYSFKTLQRISSLKGIVLHL